MDTQTKACITCQNNFTIEPDDFGFYKKMSVPPPVECPNCRLRRRMTFMNVRSLYRRTCDRTGESIISIFRPELTVPVYKQSVYWSDNWDPFEYGVDYDPTVPFLKQLHNLRNRTPHAALENLHSSMVNSEYCNYAGYMKNSYLCHFADFGENVFYTYILAHVKDTADCARITNSELCYGSVGINKSYRTFYSEECDECRNVWFSKNCTGCTDCVGCVNLRKKQYCIFNEQYSKEEYEQKIKDMNLNTHSGIQKIKKESEDFWLKHPVRYMHKDAMSFNVSGDYIYESKNAQQCYLATNVEDSKYVQFISVAGVRDSYDYTSWGNNASLMYECSTSGEGSQGIVCCDECWPSVSDLQYCIYTHSSKNCFGCANMKNAEYCILNKQYTKEEYFKLRDQIIAEMDSNPFVDKQGRTWNYGHGLPTELSLYAYNETEAGLYMPLSKEQALEKGFDWYEKEDKNFTATLQGSELPETIQEVDDTILQEIIACEKTGKAYRIVQDELTLLRQFNLPLPRRHPDVRLEERYAHVNKPFFYNRTTQDGVEVLTSYAPDRPETILSDEGWQNELC
jgi:hypothetical protein